MADVYYNDWDSLVKTAENSAKKILETDVAPVAKEILAKHIKSDIYDAYTPKENGWVTPAGEPTTYTRRHVLENSITSYMLGDNRTLLITSTATASKAIVPGYSFRNRYDGSFLKLLEVGNMGIWSGGFPRPAVKNTQDEFDKGIEINRAIKNGIKREIGNYTEI